ncbi:hypothetical protein [Butyrivibrio sp. MB2005]|uniref:hypothetical protein n=1 Tax=Butyrivibrio sp. MB2005 TaxID=1280678 RepID=UPI00047CBB36|nr:hypothetical protein [Butyrivibrio sp. MB2005]
MPICNPYLPLDEYIPDAEPHVFGNQVYIYGSHDKEKADSRNIADGSIIFQDNPKNYKSVFLVKTGGAS